MSFPSRRGARRRDVRGRGPRGPLLPPTAPGWRTRSETFDDYVLAAVERLGRRWGKEIAGIEFAVEEVPVGGDAITLGRCFPSNGAAPTRIVVYRRPIEMRAATREDTRELALDVVVEQVAAALGRAPEEIDPEY